MADWDSIIKDRVTMGRSRPLCLAMNAARRRRKAEQEERRPGVIPFLGRGDCPGSTKIESKGKGPREK